MNPKRTLSTDYLNNDKIFTQLLKLNFYADVRIISGTLSLFTAEDEKITGTNGEINGIGVRALVDGSIGYAWSSCISDFPKLLEKAERLAKLNKGKIFLSAQKPIKANAGRNSEFPHSEEKILLLKEAKKHALSQKVKNCTLALRDSNVQKIFLNSEGSHILQKESHIYFSALCISKEGAQIQRGIERLSSRKGYKNFDIIKSVENASKSAEHLLNAEAPPKGHFPIIMNPEMTGVFAHEILGHASEGDSVAERESILKGMIGKRVGSEKVNITDEPNFDDFGQYFYDDEGVKAQSVQLVEKGILKGYLHSRQSAYALNAKNNGHARAQNYEFTPIVRMSNTLFAKGKESIEDVFNVKHGIYIIGMKGGSVDIFSGDFMFAAKEAWLIKNSSKEKLLRDITISGSILKTLKKVEAVGKDFGTSPGFCGKIGQMISVSDGGPHIRVSDMRVG